MLNRFLSAEQPIADLDAKIQELDRILELRSVPDAELGEVARQRDSLAAERDRQLQEMFRSLSRWDKVLLARHPQRPYTLDYISEMCDAFDELHGDRAFGDDPAMVGGVGRIDGRSVVIVGQQKGRNVTERQQRNFGYAGPEGYRKALRLMKLAEKFHLPVITFIDTPGAYPGLGAEERGQAEAIARNLYEMAGLRTPFIALVIGEGGSGGALALGVADRVLILENSIYSVISPEGCSSILFKDAAHAEQMADSLRLTAADLKDLGIVDEIVPEPQAGAHTDYDRVAEQVKQALLRNLEQLDGLDAETLVEQRIDKFSVMGKWLE
jgi:acetyl-CoA carboxylase carboxyl transferase subunit alpha